MIPPPPDLYLHHHHLHRHVFHFFDVWVFALLLHSWNGERRNMGAGITI